METYERFKEEIQKFIFVEDVPEKVDVIFVPGNGYPQMAEQAAELFCKGYASFVLPSGKFSITKNEFSGVIGDQKHYCGKYSTEWEFLQDVLVKNGVPREAILKEDKATYTYENALLSRKVVDAAGIQVKKAILCCKSYHARRALMYYEKVFPETKFFVVPSVTDGISKENWMETEVGVDAVLGEITRIIKQFSFLMK